MGSVVRICSLPQSRGYKKQASKSRSLIAILSDAALRDLNLNLNDLQGFLRLALLYLIAFKISNNAHLELN